MGRRHLLKAAGIATGGAVVSGLAMASHLYPEPDDVPRALELLPEFAASDDRRPVRDG